MAEFFIVAHSNAAPFISDELTRFAEAGSAMEALQAFVASDPHPAGLYSAAAYATADAYHKGAKPMCRFWSPRAWDAQRAVTKTTVGVFGA